MKNSTDRSARTVHNLLGAVNGARQSRFVRLRQCELQPSKMVSASRASAIDEESYAARKSVLRAPSPPIFDNSSVRQ